MFVWGRFKGRIGAHLPCGSDDLRQMTIAQPPRTPHRPGGDGNMVREEAKPHILIVEDARDIREPLARYLREHGYRTTTAPDALAARKVLRAAGIDLVVLDIMMPGEDGLSLCRHIRESSQTPVILLTARGEEVDRII